MKLLFDENLSSKLAQMLANEYPGSAHIREVGLRGAEDRQIWDYGRAQGFAIVSKDTDFRERSYVEGFPSKVIWLDVVTPGPRSSPGSCGESANALRRLKNRTKRRSSFFRLV